MPTPHNGKTYVPLMRNWVARMMNENADKLYKKIERELLEDPINTLDKLKWLQPRETKVEVTGGIDINTQETSLEDLKVIRRLREEREVHAPQ